MGKIFPFANNFDFSFCCRFVNEFSRKIDNHLKFTYLFVVAQRGLGVLVEMIGVVVIVSVTFLSVYYLDEIGPATATLVVTYALQIIPYMNLMVSKIDVERSKELIFLCDERCAPRLNWKRILWLWREFFNSIKSKKRMRKRTMRRNWENGRPWDTLYLKISQWNTNLITKLLWVTLILIFDPSQRLQSLEELGLERVPWFYPCPGNFILDLWNFSLKVIGT